MLQTHATSGRRASGGWVARLVGFAYPPAPAFVCELCSAPTGEPHAHLLEMPQGRVLCCCRGCALLFGERDAGRYRRVPESFALLGDFALSDAQWDALDIPVGVAFFVSSTPEQKVLACYPGPAGVMRSALDLAAWTAIADANPIVRELSPDVEALLVNRTDGARDHYRVPIDRCYALTATLRSNWVGVSGGEPARRALGEFFAQLQPREA